MKILTVLIVTVLLVACTSKEEKALMKKYEKNKTYHRLLQKTEKIQLYEDKVTKVFLTATYLYVSSEEKEKKKDEVFVVGLHTEGLMQENFSLTLEGQNAKSIKTLDSQSCYLKYISFKSEWSQFYLVHFPHTDKKYIKLVLESKSYGKGVMHFSKVAKYVLGKEAF